MRSREIAEEIRDSERWENERNQYRKHNEQPGVFLEQGQKPYQIHKINKEIPDAREDAYGGVEQPSQRQRAFSC
jgi:hypothetical protein